MSGGGHCVGGGDERSDDPDASPTRPQLHRVADEGVRVFLAAYGRR